MRLLEASLTTRAEPPSQLTVHPKTTQCRISESYLPTRTKNRAQSQTPSLSIWPPSKKKHQARLMRADSWELVVFQMIWKTINGGLRTPQNVPDYTMGDSINLK